MGKEQETKRKDDYCMFCASSPAVAKKSSGNWNVWGRKFHGAGFSLRKETDLEFARRLRPLFVAFGFPSARETARRGWALGAGKNFSADTRLFLDI